MIQIHDLTIGYREKNREKVVSAHIHADIERGELTCLLGTNGVGKSTLLRTLSAFQPKLNGSIYINGKELGDYTDKQLARVVSVVLTEKCDIRNLSVTDLIGMGRSPYTGFWGTLRKEDRDVINRAISLIGIEPLAHRMVHTLSDGERQKVMIAKALAQETSIILLDEPTAFLDYPSKVEMMQLLHRLSRQMGKTIFLSTHDLELALQAADCLWLMSPSEGIAVGSPEDLALDGSLARFFVRRGIRFDRHSGLFRIEFDCPTRLRLMGDGERYTMMRKALRRNGIEASRDVESEYSIRIGDAGYTFCRNAEPVASVTSIRQVVEVVRSALYSGNGSDSRCQGINSKPWNNSL